MCVCDVYMQAVQKQDLVFFLVNLHSNLVITPISSHCISQAIRCEYVIVLISVSLLCANSKLLLSAQVQQGMRHVCVLWLCMTSRCGLVE